MANRCHLLPPTNQSPGLLNTRPSTCTESPPAPHCGALFYGPTAKASGKTGLRGGGAPPRLQHCNRHSRSVAIG